MRFTLQVRNTTVTYFSLQKNFLIRIHITLSKNPKSRFAQRDDAMASTFTSPYLKIQRADLPKETMLWPLHSLAIHAHYDKN